MRKYTVPFLIRAVSCLTLAAAIAGLSAGASTGAEANPSLTPSTRTPADAPQYDRPIRTKGRVERAGYERVPMRPGELKAAPDYMPIGRAILAPTGFLEMCARSPSDCIHAARYDDSEIRDEARKALVQKYDIAFGRTPRNAEVQTASIAEADPHPAATDDAPQFIRWDGQNRPLINPLLITPQVTLQTPPLLTPASAASINYLPSDNQWVAANGKRAALISMTDSQPGAITGDAPVRYLNWRNKAPVAATAPTANAPETAQMTPVTRPAAMPVSLESAPYDRRQYRATLIASSGRPQDRTQNREMQPAVDDYDRITPDSNTMRMIRIINNDVNRTVRSESDVSIYHKADYWAAPGLTRGARGDCEDFALEKRRQLIDNGIPAGALSIAIVVTRRGEQHAVLIVSTTEGDVVLDNMQYDVYAWRRADYTWVSRQAPGQTLGWVSLAPANGASSNRQIRTMRVAYAQ